MVKVRGEVNPADIMTKSKNNDAVKAVFDLYTSIEINERRKNMNEVEMAAAHALTRFSVGVRTQPHAIAICAWWVRAA